MWLPGLRRARYRETVWVAARPEVVIGWLCDPHRRQQEHFRDVAPWELVEGPTFVPLTADKLQVRYTVRYADWTTNVEIVDVDRTDRSISRRIVLVMSRAGARRPATAVVRLRVNVAAERDGAKVTSGADARLVGLVRLFTLLGFHDSAVARAMLRRAQAICQRVSTVVLEEFGSSE